jgi:hypothetical protein
MPELSDVCNRLSDGEVVHAVGTSIANALMSGVAGTTHLMNIVSDATT